MKHVIYVSSAISEEQYYTVIHGDDRTDQQAQIFNRNVMHGLQQNGYQVHAVSYRARFHSENRGVEKSEDGIEYTYIDSQPGTTKSRFRILINCITTVNRMLKQFPNAIVFSDALNVTIATGAVIASKQKGAISIGIVTDVPGVFNHGINAQFNRVVISLFSRYVFLTEAMNDILNHRRKPYAVMEGIYHGNIKPCLMSNKPDIYINKKKFNVLYAGALSKCYGIENLVNAWDYIPDTDVELHLFGHGDCYQLIVDKKKNDSRVHYYGLVNNTKVIEIEKDVTLLVNPRSKEEEFTKYSFPSKTIEYMATGTPVLMQHLPGMPEDYLSHILIYEGDSPQRLAEAILKIKSMEPEALSQIGKKARMFVVDQKNSTVQVARLLKNLGIDI